MSATELAAYLQSATPRLIDVREPWEFEICHIAGSENLPMGQVPQNIDWFDDDNETIVICHHGIRSAQVIHFLQQQDVDQLINLDGGVDAWAREVDLDMPVY